MAGYLDASGLKHFKRKNDATYLGKQEKAASAKVADSVVWENVSGRPDLSALIPPGTIIHYAGRTVPSGWLICNGANVSRTDYAALFAAIGTIYGAGDGSTTFNLPDLHHRVLEGTNTLSEVAQKVEAGLPDISGYSDQTGGSDDKREPSGVFSNVELAKGYDMALTPKKDYTVVGLVFKASKGNGLFGRSQTIQMASSRLLAIIKI